jgi:hypothetical protein
MPQADCQSACIPLRVKTNESNSIGRVNGRGQVPSRVPRRGRIGLGVDELLPLNPCEGRAVRALAHLAASFAQPSARCGDAPHVAPRAAPFLRTGLQGHCMRERGKESANHLATLPATPRALGEARCSCQRRIATSLRQRIVECALKHARPPDAAPASARRAAGGAQQEDAHKEHSMLLELHHGVHWHNVWMQYFFELGGENVVCPVAGP